MVNSATKIIKIYTENNDFQFLETLRRNRNKRHKANKFIVEGVRALNDVVANDWKITAFIYSRDKKLSSWANELIGSVTTMYNYELPDSLLQKLSDKEETSELMALVEMKNDDLSRIPLNAPFTIIIFDQPGSPGNLGTIIRSAEAFGANGLIISGHAVDLYSQEVINASTGTVFSLPVIRVESRSEIDQWLNILREKYKDLAIIGGDENAETQLSALDLKHPLIVTLGNETDGLSNGYKELCKLFSIPTIGKTKSLNVATAGSIVLYEISRQRQSNSIDTPLPES